MSGYSWIEADVFHDPAKSKLRLRPAPGGDFPPSMRISCSIRKRPWHAGSRVRIRVKVVNRAGKAPYLYSHYDWPWKEAESRD